MLHLILYQPEIPPNTGNIIRLCANMGAKLHLIHPLGFELDHKQLRRAGLDYHEFANVEEYISFDEFKKRNPTRRLFACSTKGKRYYSDASYSENDGFIFGPETRGLPPEILSTFVPENIIRIPMLANSRSLNLSNAAAVILYEAWKQLGFRVTT